MHSLCNVHDEYICSMHLQVSSSRMFRWCVRSTQAWYMMWCENDMFCIEHIYASFLNGLSVIHILVGPSVIGHPACTFHVEVASSICVFFILHVLG
jgi:hypothetical protein